MIRSELYVALVHFPVLNKAGETICSAVTNLDIHDIARLSRTYGIKKYYIVTILSDQEILTKQIISHWHDGAGGKKNPARKEAFSIIKVTGSIDEVLEDIKKETGSDAKIIATSAREFQRSLSYPVMKNKLNESTGAYLLTFGTAWGLTPEFVGSADYVLKPLKGHDGYNHLSVRSAASIIIDRLTGE